MCQEQEVAANSVARCVSVAPRTAQNLNVAVQLYLEKNPFKYGCKVWKFALPQMRQTASRDQLTLGKTAVSCLDRGGDKEKITLTNKNSKQTLKLRFYRFLYYY